MQSIGLVLIIIGFLAGSLVAVLEADAVNWLLFLPALAIGVLGVAMVQIAMRRYASDVTRLSSNTRALRDSLERVVDKLGSLNRDKADIDTYDLPERIDQTLRDDINTFVEARESIVYLWGVQSYGEIMSHFAAGERYLNRVWSSAADGYIIESHTYLARSLEQFSQARKLLQSLAKNSDAQAA